MIDRFEHGFTVRIRDDVRRLDRGLLVGGSPVTAVRLSPAAQACLDDDQVVVDGSTSATVAATLLDRNLADPLLTARTPDPTSLTVVIPVRDRPLQLDRALTALGALEVVVVDDASVEAAAIAAVASTHGARLIRLPENVGPAGARNAGLTMAGTAYVAFVDSDVTVDAATLLRLCRHFVDERVGLVGPRVVSRARSRHPRWHERYDEAASSLALGTRPCSVRPGAAVGWLPSACVVGRRDRLGTGFDPSLRVGEDVDLVWRLVAGDQRVRYDPSETAHHDARPSVTQWLGRKFVYGTGGAPLAARHGDLTAPAIISPPMALAAGAVLARRWWSPVVAGGIVAHTAWSLNRRLPETDGRRRLAVSLSAQSLGWAVRQEAALVLRHWWPATAVLLPDRRMRRVVVSALLTDAVIGRREHPRADPFHQLLGRRLDDLAYGGGLWLGALRARSFRCLIPRALGPGSAAKTVAGRGQRRATRGQSEDGSVLAPA